MKIPLTIILFIGTFLMCKNSNDHNPVASTILMDIEFLKKTKSSVQNQDPKIKNAFDQLLKEAEAALLEGPFSVTHKEDLPPSGDKHDYASFSRYWWPDPDQPDGLPYIRKDGLTNPESQSAKKSDRPRIESFAFNTETLGLAYYLTGQEKFARKAAELLRVWFLNRDTRMNPNLNHAQCRLGHNQGTKSGVLDGRLMVRALEGSLLISSSPALSTLDKTAIKDWVKEYLNWLTSNEMALQEAASNNNHGSYYDAQVMYFALYSEDQTTALRTAKDFLNKRVHPQVESNGSMPEEIARTRPLFYSIYNLHAMFLVASLAEKVQIDIWERNSENSLLQSALDFLVPYSDPALSWPASTKFETDRMDIFAILMMANHAYPERNYLSFLEKLPLDRRSIHRMNLAYPLMR